jgi:GNAT superfamily N-acetyltransferase
MEPIDPSSIASLEAATRDWIAPRLANGRYRGYLGLLDGLVVATAAMLVYELPPLGSNTCRRQGHVLNVWTQLGYRRRGYSRQVLEFLITDAQCAGIWRLFLNSTPTGEPLYRDLGFHEQEERALVKHL